MSTATETALHLQVHTGPALPQAAARLQAYALHDGRLALSRHPAWLLILQRGLQHVPYLLEAVRDGRTCGFLPLCYVRSLLFGRFLVSLPYLNTAGVMADDEEATRALIDRAVSLADELRVRFLELRHERPVEHPSLPERMNSKVLMRLALPGSPEDLWKKLNSRVRNHVRVARNHDLTVHWGAAALLDDFYAVFSQNMRDLGTPVYSRALFQAALEQFPGQAELCVIRAGAQPLAAGLLLHGWKITEVPSSSSLRAFNRTNANMLLYWHLLERSIERGQEVFDFGRSSRDSGTYKFKAGWGARPEPAEWQYYCRTGSTAAMRPENPRNQRLVRIWQKLPVPLTRWIGPRIIRGIP